MTTIGGIWLYAWMLCAGAADACTGQPQFIQRVYPTLAACERAKAAMLRNYPAAYVVCDR